MRKLGQLRRGSILIVEDNAPLCDMLQLVLATEGHRTAAPASGAAARGLVAGNGFRPDLIVSGFAGPTGCHHNFVRPRTSETEA